MSTTNHLYLRRAEPHVRVSLKKFTYAAAVNVVTIVGPYYEQPTTLDRYQQVWMPKRAQALLDNTNDELRTSRTTHTSATDA